MARVRVGDLEIAYETDGVGEPVLLLMGLGGDRHGWDLVRAELARRHRLILLDNRDAGESGHAGASYTVADMAGDALGVADHLGLSRFHVVGASMGGAIAQQLALGAPDRIASLALISTWGRTDAFLAAVFRGWRTAVARLPPDEFLATVVPWAFTHRFFQDPPPALIAQQTSLARRGPLPAAAYQRQVDACLTHDLLGMLPLLRTPALVLVGEDDILTPPRYARALAAALPRAALEVVPAGGHACFLETPAAVADRLLHFFGRHRLAVAA